MGLLSWKMKRFWDEAMAPQWMKVDVKIACAFSFSGGWRGKSLLEVAVPSPCTFGTVRRLIWSRVDAQSHVISP
jgi:hypothetical protein